MDVMLSRLKALIDPRRLKILAVLQQKDLCVESLAKCLEISQSAVSQHMRILREAGLVEGEKRGYYTHYHVQEEVLKETADRLTNLSGLFPVEEGCGCPDHSTAEHDCCCRS